MRSLDVTSAMASKSENWFSGWIHFIMTLNLIINQLLTTVMLMVLLFNLVLVMFVSDLEHIILLMERQDRSADT